MKCLSLLALVWLLLAGVCFIYSGLMASVARADTQQNITKYERYDDGNTTFSIHDKVIAAQTFTTELTHDISYIALFGYIEGDPTYIKVQLQTANSTIIASAVPTGDLVYHWFGAKSEADMSEEYFTGNESGSWIVCQLNHAAKLEGNQTYSIVVKALAGGAIGNGTNYFHWYYQDVTGNYTKGAKVTSSNGGKTWTVDADADFMFETWGECGIKLQSAQVYNGFYESGDWLIVCSYLNKAPTYYKDDDIEQHFRLQFIDNTNSEVAGETVLRWWDAAVASIYLNPDEVSGLEWETGNFTLRILATYGGNWYIDYNLAPADFIGDTLTFLDKWCISQAQWMGTINYGDDMRYLRKTNIGLILNAEEGVGAFEVGIPRLGAIRGQYICETYMDEATLNPVGAPNPALQNRFVWTTSLGTDLAAILDELGAPFHLSGKVIGLVVMLVLYVFVVGGSFPAGHSTAGASVGFVIILIGMIAGVVDVIWPILALIFALGLGLRQLVLVGQ